MKKPQFEDPINNVKDLVEQNITLFVFNSTYLTWKEYFMKQNISEWTEVAENMIAADHCDYYVTGIVTCANTSGNYFHNLKHHVHGTRTHAVIKGFCVFIC